MIGKRRLAAAAALAVCMGCHAERPDTADDVLPLRTLRLYETGVGYFERSGRLDADSTTTLPVPTGHLDDALKTLVVVTADGSAVVSGVEFSSSVTPGMAKKLAGLPASGDPVTYRVLLSSLIGAHVAMTVERIRPADGDEGAVRIERETLTGRLVHAGPATEGGSHDSDDSGKRLRVVVKTDEGALLQLSGSEIVSVRPTDPAQAARIDGALDTMSSGSARTPRALRLLATSNGPVTLGYVTEAPIWRPSYRLVLDRDSGRATLQAWALVHNNADERWQGVRVELVNGRPDSFLFPMAAPRYARRPLAEPSELMSTAPQLFDTTADRIWGEHIDSIPVTGYGSAGGAGFGSGHGRFGASHRARAPRVRMGRTEVSSSALAVGNLAEVAQADGVESGALFSYTLEEPLDLRPHGSALVPFLHRDVEAKRITLFSDASAAGRAAVRFVNSTRQTLPAGPLAVFEANGFAGESALDRLKPEERLFVSYGVDLDVELQETERESVDSVQAVRVDGDRLVVDFVRRQTRKLSLHSRSGTPRVVLLSLSDIVNNAKVEGAEALDYDQAAGHALAVFELAPGARQDEVLRIEEGLADTEAIADVSARRLGDLAGEAALGASERTVLKRAFEQATAAEQKRAQVGEIDEGLAHVDADLERLRKHLQALGDKSATGPGGANPLVQRILAAEDERVRLYDEKKRLLQAEASDREAMRQVLEELAGAEG